MLVDLSQHEYGPTPRDGQSLLPLRVTHNLPVSGPRRRRPTTTTVLRLELATPVVASAEAVYMVALYVSSAHSSLGATVDGHSCHAGPHEAARSSASAIIGSSIVANMVASIVARFFVVLCQLCCHPPSQDDDAMIHW